MTILKFLFLLSTVFPLTFKDCWGMEKEDDFIVHDFVRGISYKEGQFQFYEAGYEKYTEPHKVSTLMPQYAENYNKAPQSLRMEESLLMRVLEGKDGRTQITETTKWPYRIHGQLTMTWEKDYGGSGVLVGPHHVLTAAHNVYEETKKWPSTIYVYLGLNENLVPFGNRKVMRAYTFSQWVKAKNKSYDMALLLLDDSIGYKIGWSGLRCLSDWGSTQSEVSITGYPGDKGFKKMMTMSHQIKTVKAEEYYYDIDTAGGQSGSAIWINLFTNPYVVGIHAYGEGRLFTGNSGVRLSSAKFDKIISWISKSLILEELTLNDAIHKTAIRRVLLMCAHGENSYLAVNGVVKSDSYQRAFFGTQKYLDNNKASYTNSLSLLEDEDGTCRILCKFGYISYLAVDGVVKNDSYRWAIFGNPQYLKTDKASYSNTFRLIQERQDTYRIQCNFGDTSYLAINGKVKKGSYQWAFFGTQEYLDNNKTAYCSDFYIENVGNLKVLEG